MNKKRGMTVVETLITLAILGMLIVMSLYLGKRQVQRADFSSAINQFVADLAYARQLASRGNRYVAFDFNTEGSKYTIMVQRRIGMDPGTASSFRLDREVEPMNGEQFVEVPSDFSVNALGVIHDYPVKINDPPKTLIFNFIKMDLNTGSKAYETKLTLYPSGGVKIEKQK